MKKILLSTVAIVGFSAGAFAADLPARTMAPAPFVPVAPVFTWTGFYAGVNAGYAWADSEENTFFVPAGSVPGFPAASGTVFYGDNSDDGGFTGGGQIGYNYQFGSFVVGAEADLQYADLGRDRFSYSFPGSFPTTYVAPAPGGGVEWFGTVRARLGFAIDRLLVYGTGGFAYGGGDDSGNNGLFVNNDDDIRTGWTLGGGVEYAVTNNVIVGLEGLYVSLDRSDRGGNGGYYTTATGAVVPVTVPVTKNNDNEFGVVRARLNYKF